MPFDFPLADPSKINKPTFITDDVELPSEDGLATPHTWLDGNDNLWIYIGWRFTGLKYSRNRILVASGFSYDSGNEVWVENIDLYDPTDFLTGSDFGNLSSGFKTSTGFSNGNGNVGIFVNNNSNPVTDGLQYVIMNSLSNSDAFGDLETQFRQTGYGDVYGLSNGTGNIGLLGGGWDDDNSVVLDTIDYYSINTPGTAGDFSGLLSSQRLGAVCCSNGMDNMGLYISGTLSGYTNTTDNNGTPDVDENLSDKITYLSNNTEYVIISIPGENAIEFAELVSGFVRGGWAVSNDTNGLCVVGGGYISGTNTSIHQLQYLHLRLPGENATLWEDLRDSEGCSAASNGVRNTGLIFGGFKPDWGTVTNKELINSVDSISIDLTVDSPITTGFKTLKTNVAWSSAISNGAL